MNSPGIELEGILNRHSKSSIDHTHFKCLFNVITWFRLRWNVFEKVG